MVETAADTLIDSLVADFGGNYTFVVCTDRDDLVQPRRVESGAHLQE